jgi:CRISPR-associated protein Csb1
VPPLDYFDAGLVDAPDDKKTLDAASELGLRHAPAAGTLGGVIVRGEIRREVILSLVGVRALGPRGNDGGAVRRYVLGLALVAMTYDRPHDLRQGCLLVRDPKRPSTWELVGHDGLRKTVETDHVGALAFAREAAAAFGVGENREVEFDRKTANAAIAEKAKPKGRKALG